MVWLLSDVMRTQCLLSSGSFTFWLLPHGQKMAVTALSTTFLYDSVQTRKEDADGKKKKKGFLPMKLWLFMKSEILSWKPQSVSTHWLELGHMFTTEDQSMPKGSSLAVIGTDTSLSIR